MRLYRLFSLLILCLMLVSGSITWAQDSAPQLRDLPVFADQRYGMWAGSGDGLTLSVEDGSLLPIDGAMTRDGLPSLRIDVSGACCGGWWAAILAGENWETYDLRPYIANGALEFNIRGSANIDNFAINLRDHVNTRATAEQDAAEVNLAEYISLTDDWQAVRIPLQAFVAGTDFEPRQMAILSIGSSGDATGTLWINNLRFTSPDAEPQFPAIKINQVGYSPDGQKNALVSSYTLDFDAGQVFTVVDADTGASVYTGELSLITDIDEASGEHVWSADFSDLNTEGTYIMQIEGAADSPRFRIAADVYDNLLVDVMRYYYFQRQGIALAADYAGPFARGIGHPQDNVAAFRSGIANARDASGGWYDAGDYGKYVNAGSLAVSDLLWAYRLFPDAFPDGQSNIPESGNGLPDLLDEVRWELDWMLKMQDGATGGFWSRVGTTEDGSPDEAVETRYIEDSDEGRSNVMPTANSASAVAALAMASTVYDAIDPAYAATLVAAAESGWNYLEAHPEGVASIPGPYMDDQDADERLWAAAALYNATSEDRYQQYYLANYQTFVGIWQSRDDNAYGVGLTGMLAFMEYGMADNPDSAAVAWFADQYTPWRAHMLDRAQSGVWGTTLLYEDYYWGSNAPALWTVVTLAAGDAITGQTDDATIQVAQQTLSYILGQNPLHFSYVSGYGVDYVRRPHSAIWSNDEVDAIPAGILVGGPNAYTNPLLWSTAPAKRYVDSDHDWSTNEHTIYWNSPLVFVIAMIQAH